MISISPNVQNWRRGSQSNSQGNVQMYSADEYTVDPLSLGVAKAQLRKWRMASMFTA